MVFTVGLPSGIREFDFGAYVRMLGRDGINIADTPRVRDPQTGSRWLHAWSDRAQAERFASRVREESENPSWEVYELPDTEASTGPLGPLEVVVSRRGDGYAYGLPPTTQRLVRQRFPEAKLVKAVFIATDTRGDFQASQGPVWDQVVKILTGLSDEWIEDLGGYTLCSPEGDVLREAPALVH